MSDAKQIKERLNTIENKISKHEYNTKGLELELEDIKKQIYMAVDQANKEDREELDNLIMFINYLKTKFRYH